MFILNIFFCLGVNQDYSKNFVRITIKIPKMKTGLNWRNFIREAKNGITTEATYHGKYENIFLVNFPPLFYFFAFLVGSILNLFSIEVNPMKPNMDLQPVKHFMGQLNIIKVI